MDLNDDDAVKRECGRRIRAARDAIGLTQGQLAEAVGLSPSAIGNYEQGIRLPGPREATLLGRELGINPAYILLVEGEEMLLFEDEALLLERFRGLSPQDQQRALIQLDRLKKLHAPNVTRHLKTIKTRKR